MLKTKRYAGRRALLSRKEERNLERENHGKRKKGKDFAL